MSSSEKGGRQDLKQYYSLLQKYEPNSKSRLRKDNSTSSFSREAARQPLSYAKETPATAFKDPSRTTPSSTLYKATFLPERQKITITDKPATKPVLQRFESAALDSMKKARPNEERKFNVSESLANSAISKKWPTENAEEKENVAFTAKEENAFTDHCSQLYRLRSSPTLVQDITREINKRDEVYQLVGAQFPRVAQEKYVQTLEAYFEEHLLMQRIINEFKAVSKLETEDLTQLYYFLKSDSS